MKEKFAQGRCFYKFFWLFLLGCIFGAYYEEIGNMLVHLIKNHEFLWERRRGLLYGPISPIYGFGTVIFIFLLGKKHRKPWQIILYGALLGGIFEYLMSYFQEVLMGTVSWDYSSYFLNINGRTTIPFALVWGVFALVLVKFVYPTVSIFLAKIPIKIGKIVTNILIVFLCLDFFLSWGALLRQKFRQNGQPPITVVGKFFDKYYTDERLNKEKQMAEQNAK